MTILVPPPILDEMQAVLDLPVVTHEFLKIGSRDLRRVEACDEVSRVMRTRRVLSVEHLAINTKNDLTIRQIQLLTKVIGVVEIVPEFADFDAAFFLLNVTLAGSPGSENACFTASYASP